MCECVEEKERELKKLGLENPIFPINKGSIYKTYSEAKYGKRKKAVINHQYCPFCGEKYEGA